LWLCAFISRFHATLGSTRCPERVGTWLADPERCTEVPAADDEVRAQFRTALRQGGFKPTGRSKPSSEYLLRARAEAALRAINPAVDAGNALSLRSGLPISVVDLDRLTLPVAIREAGAGESYVFNPAGQVLSLAGLPCLYDAAGPCANAVKDAQRTKTSELTRNTLNLIWSCPEQTARTQATLHCYRELLAEVATLEAVEVQRVSPANS
jgi:DNA/RNA-binding domain of Phe-tRNA-synthetase-like protein